VLTAGAYKPVLQALAPAFEQRTGHRLVVDNDTAGALVFLEELSESGQDLGRLVTDLLEHLRHLLLVQHTGEVPDTLPVTDETRERLREQANQLGPATVVRLIDLLAVAVEDMRQGGDPRLPLELALVKVTRPGSDLSRESLAFRIERLEHGRVTHAVGTPLPPVARDTESRAPERPEPTPPAAPAAEPDLELEQLQEAWRRTILPAVEQRSIPIGKTLAEAHPAGLAGETLTLEFPQSASFHLKLAEDPKNAALLRDALYEVTGRKLALEFELGEAGETDAEHDDAPTTEDDILNLMKSTFDARELDQ